MHPFVKGIYKMSLSIIYDSVFFTFELNIL